MFRCNTFEFANHKHVDFPSSNKRMTIPFALVHSNLWGFSSIPNLSGVHWFVIFIDACTRVSWVFLLKQKSEVSQVFEDFIQMIKNQFEAIIKRVLSERFFATKHCLPSSMNKG